MEEDRRRSGEGKPPRTGKLEGQCLGGASFPGKCGISASQRDPHLRAAETGRGAHIRALGDGGKGISEVLVHLGNSDCTHRKK